MANLMLYAKEKGDKRFGAVDMASHTFPVGLMYATIVPEAKLEVLKQRASMLHKMNPRNGLEVYMRGTYGDYDIDQGTLLSALRNAICYLVTLAGKSSGNSSDELIQLKQYLNECKTKYADIESQNRDLNAEIDTLRSVIADYKSRIQKAEEKIQELTGKNQNLANEKSAWVDKMKEKDRTISDLTEQGFRLTREVDVLEKDNAVLESKQKELWQHRIIRQKEPSYQYIAFGRTVYV